MIFYSYGYSMDGMPGAEALSGHNRLDIPLSFKLKQ